MVMVRLLPTMSTRNSADHSGSAMRCPNQATSAPNGPVHANPQRRTPQTGAPERRRQTGSSHRRASVVVLAWALSATATISVATSHHSRIVTDPTVTGSALNTLTPLSKWKVNQHTTT